jgi:transcriptional regulator with XRE-family HTH domain
MKLEELVGERVREARELRGWTQQHLGEQLEPYLGRVWTRQAVSNAEKGGREFTAAELVAFALTLRQRVGWFFMAGTGDPLTLPGSEEVGPGQLLDLFASMGDLVASEEASDHLASLGRINDEIRDQALAIERRTAAVREYLSFVQGVDAEEVHG